VGDFKGFNLLFYNFEAVKNVGIHVNVSHKARNLVSLLDDFVQGGAAIFAPAPVDNNFHFMTALMLKMGIKPLASILNLFAETVAANQVSVETAGLAVRQLKR